MKKWALRIIFVLCALLSISAVIASKTYASNVDKNQELPFPGCPGTPTSTTTPTSTPVDTPTTEPTATLVDTPTTEPTATAEVETPVEPTPTTDPGPTATTDPGQTPTSTPTLVPEQAPVTGGPASQALPEIVALVFGLISMGGFVLSKKRIDKN